MTPRELFQWAESHRLADAPIRITDAECVSMYPTMSVVAPFHYEIVIDVSTLDMLDYDEVRSKIAPLQ